MGKLCDLEQVDGQTAHELTGAVSVIEIVAQTLHMTEQILTDICLYPDAEGMSPVADHIVSFY